MKHKRNPILQLIHVQNPISQNSQLHPNPDPQIPLFLSSAVYWFNSWVPLLNSASTKCNTDIRGLGPWGGFWRVGVTVVSRWWFQPTHCETSARPSKCVVLFPQGYRAENRKPLKPLPVGGWTNPLEKIWVKMGSSSPIFGVNIKNVWVATT